MLMRVLRGPARTLLVLLAVLILCYAGAPAGYSPSARTAVAPAAVNFQPPDEVTDREVNPFGPWTPASPTAMAAFGCVVLSALFLLLYAYRRRRYILQWMFGWLIMAISQMVISLPYDLRPVGLAMLGLSRFFGIVAILMLILSADTYQRRMWGGRRYLVGLLPLLIWFALAPIVLGSRSALVPGYLIAAAALATGAFAYLGMLRRAQLLGAGLIGSTMVLLAVSHTWIAVVVSRAADPVVPLEAMVANALLYLFAALGMHVLVFEDMTYELRKTNRQLTSAQGELRELVITDPLTRCYNRRFFDEVIHREVQRHERYDIPMSFLFVDIDRFKEVNDTLGHEAGDRLLQYVSLFLKRNVREADYVFRWGGDEFLLLLSCRLEAARQKGAELKRAFLGALDTAELPGGVGLSVGYSELITPDDDVMERVREADDRMYEDKVAAR